MLVDRAVLGRPRDSPATLGDDADLFMDLPHDTGVDAALMQGSDGSIGYANHSAIGAHYAARLGFPRAVSGAVGLHVAAKRALVSHEPAYMGLLSKFVADSNVNAQPIAQ